MVIVEKVSNRIVASCLAGIGKEGDVPRKNTYVTAISVLPECNGRGLAKFMLGHIVSRSYGLTHFTRLVVEVGNRAEYLYRQMGFIAGPRYTKMVLRS